MPWDFSLNCKSVKDCKAGYTCVRFYWAHYDPNGPFYCRYNMILESEENHESSSSSQSSSDEYWIQLGIRHNIIILESFLHYQFRNVKVEFNPKMSLGQFNIFSFMTENVYRRSSTIITHQLLQNQSRWNHWNHHAHIQESKNLKKVAWT